MGDAFRLLPPGASRRPVEYRVAGIVSLPGWHWMTKFSGLRRRSGRSAAMVFAPYDFVRRDFDLDRIHFFWMNLEDGARVDDVGWALKRLADRRRGERQPVNDQGTWPFAVRMFGDTVRTTSPGDIREVIAARADGMIWGMSQLPLITLAIASLGVVNTVMASIRARRWEIGVLRAIGVTRAQLFRLIVAEAVLIGLAACALSLAFGVMAGWCGTGISQHASFFGGMSTPLVIPWVRLGLGFGFTLILCLAAALWPAASAARAEPLALLAYVNRGE